MYISDIYIILYRIKKKQYKHAKQELTFSWGVYKYIYKMNKGCLQGEYYMYYNTYQLFATSIGSFIGLYQIASAPLLELYRFWIFAIVDRQH